MNHHFYSPDYIWEWRNASNADAIPATEPPYDPFAEPPAPEPIPDTGDVPAAVPVDGWDSFGTSNPPW
jgi:hypothetical protein